MWVLLLWKTQRIIVFVYPFLNNNNIHDKLWIKPSSKTGRVFAQNNKDDAFWWELFITFKTVVRSNYLNSRSLVQLRALVSRMVIKMNNAIFRLNSIIDLDDVNWWIVFENFCLFTMCFFVSFMNWTKCWIKQIVLLFVVNNHGFRNTHFIIFIKFKWACTSGVCPQKYEFINKDPSWHDRILTYKIVGSAFTGHLVNKTMNLASNERKLSKLLYPFIPLKASVM